LALVYRAMLRRAR